jgi:hypothetical protein
MRTTLNIEDSLLDQAHKMTGIKEKTTLVKLGLEALIARESGKRLAKLLSRQPCNVVISVVSFLHNQPGRIGRYEEIYCGTC